MNCEAQDGGEAPDCGQDGSTNFTLSLADRWIISRLQRTEEEVAKALDGFRFDHAAQALYEFVWNEYCDWYLELSKPVLWDDNASAEAKKGTRRTLIRVLETTLRLLHPMMPFITEEIWQRVAPLAGIPVSQDQSDSLMLQRFPIANAERIDADAEADIEWLKKVIEAVRNIRGEMNIAPSREIPLLLRNGDDDDRRRSQQNATFLKKLAKLSDIRWLDAGEEAPLSATQLAGAVELLVPMADLIDKNAELARLTKEIDKIAKDIERIETKLGNPGFAAKAPADVVAKEREKCEAQRGAMQQLQQQRDRIAAL